MYCLLHNSESTKLILRLTEIKSFVLVLSALTNAKSNLLESIRHWRLQSSNVPLTFLDFTQIADEVEKERQVFLFPSGHSEKVLL